MFKKRRKNGKKLLENKKLINEIFCLRKFHILHLLNGKKNCYFFVDLCVFLVVLGSGHWFRILDSFRNCNTDTFNSLQ